MTAKTGDNVKVHYTGTLTDGSVFDSSRERDPLAFTIGQGQLLKKFEDSVIGLAVGESIDVHMTPEEGYGAKNPQLIAKVPRTELPPEIKPEPGLKLQSQTPQGHVMVLKIVEMDDETITVDGNHELADQELNFNIELVEIG